MYNRPCIRYRKGKCFDLSGLRRRKDTHQASLAPPMTVPETMCQDFPPRVGERGRPGSAATCPDERRRGRARASWQRAVTKARGYPNWQQPTALRMKGMDPKRKLRDDRVKTASPIFRENTPACSRQPCRPVRRALRNNGRRISELRTNTSWGKRPFYHSFLAVHFLQSLWRRKQASTLQPSRGK